MKKPTKFVKPLTDEQRAGLQEIVKTSPNFRRRTRAHAILLSDRKRSIDDIADIFQTDRDRVSQWLDWWENDGVDGLDDDPRSGRPPALSKGEQRQAIEMVKDDPRSLKCVAARVKATFNKLVGRDTLAALATEAGLVWKRVRRGLKGKRNETDFRATQAALTALRAVCRETDLGLAFGDEAGFTLTPCLPYAWQPVGERLELACATHQQRQNIFGILEVEGEFVCSAFTDPIDSSVVIDAIDRYRRALSRPTFLWIDNAGIHTGADVQDAIDEWWEQGLYVHFLPPYSPELNLIEHLWRKIKYEWLPLDAYSSFEKLTEELFRVLKGVGSKYLITFS